MLLNLNKFYKTSNWLLVCIGIPVFIFEICMVIESALILKKLNGKEIIVFEKLSVKRSVYSTCTNLLRIKDLRKVSTYPLVCLRFSQTLLHQDLGTSLRKKSLNLGLSFKFKPLIFKNSQTRIYCLNVIKLTFIN